MQAVFPLHRFEEFGDLTADEANALASAGLPPVHFDRLKRIRAEGVASTSFYLLASGWVIASEDLASGARQITKIHLPGDALGTPSMCMTETVEELTCLTKAVVIEVPLENFARLIEQHPRMGVRFLLSVQRERIALADRLISIGQTSALARVSAFLLDLLERLTPVGLVTTDGFHLVPTQQQIGEVLGLTGVHTNRTMRELTDGGFISRDGQQLTIRNKEGLERIAQRPTRILQRHPSWLPAPRRETGEPIKRAR